MPKYKHNFWPLYKQPKIKSNVLILECDCGEAKRVDAVAFLNEAARQRKVYLFDRENNSAAERIDNEKTPVL